MSIERKQIVKPYLLLCEGRDLKSFLKEGFVVTQNKPAYSDI